MSPVEQMEQRYKRVTENFADVHRHLTEVETDLKMLMLRFREKDGHLIQSQHFIDTLKTENEDLRIELQVLREATSSPMGGEASGEREPAGGTDDDDH